MSLVPLGSIIIEPNPAENFPLIASIVVAGMYWIGGRRFRAACRKGTIGSARINLERRRTFYFVSGLVVLVLALQEPMDKWSDELFWVHMVQHMLLIVVVAPLILLGAPWMRVFRALPLRWRRSLSLWALRGRTGAPVRAIARAVAKPKVAWALLALDIVLWHIPGAYDLTLSNNAVHYFEHATFLIFALFAWGHLIESQPFHCVLGEPGRIAFAFSQMVVMWMLGLTLAFATKPWYSAYAKLIHRPGGISALTDQHLAGGIMWVPASLPWSVAIFVWIYRWVSDGFMREPPEEVSVRAPVAPTPTPGPVPRPAASHDGHEGPAPTLPTRPKVAEPIARASALPLSSSARGYPLAYNSYNSNEPEREPPGTAPHVRRNHG